MTTAEKFDLILIGTGFASTFFLHEYLRRAPSNARILALERGLLTSHATLLQDPYYTIGAAERDLYTNATPRYMWEFGVGFGGGSNHWGASTPRFMPDDFRMHSLYGVGNDWPLTYEELEPYYCEVEELMAVSGPAESSAAPRSRPYPQPPHRFSEPDKLLKAAFPDKFFNAAVARPPRGTARRVACCGNKVCHMCPIDAKFTVLNEMAELYKDPRVTLRLQATASHIVLQNQLARSVQYVCDGKTGVASAEAVAVGANAIFNPHLLLASGLAHAELGRGLTRHSYVTVALDLRGVDAFQGSTLNNGVGYMLYSGAHRVDRAAALLETWDRPELREERGKWRQKLTLSFILEDLRQSTNYVALDKGNPSKPVVHFDTTSDYTRRGFAALESAMSPIAAALPLERMTFDKASSVSNHIMGTTCMGNQSDSSVVDRYLRHHQVRNLLVLGSSVFPTAPPSNPTLTLSALSLWAARHFLQ